MKTRKPEPKCTKTPAPCDRPWLDYVLRKPILDRDFQRAFMHTQLTLLAAGEPPIVL